ncbi:MAG TPA: glycosyltransferase family 39 protein [Alphaproteobacteria bacterium]|nr:glycosyltransferase family 39 protein [Alphaproteobacteria bacterium]
MTQPDQTPIFDIPPASQPVRRWQMIAFWVAIVLGTILRFAALGKVPAGVLPDEASTGVDALSIWQSGMDRWGNHWPIWFPAWGSGMNMLFTYIAAPVVGIFGLSTVSLRAVEAFFGVLTLVTAYHAGRLWFGRSAGLVVLCLLAFLPWHVMTSRFTLDSNLVPLLFTLGLITLHQALTRGGRWPLLAPLPWALCVYAYPVSLQAMLISGLAIAVIERRTIRPRLGWWAAGVAIGIAIDIPFLLFIAKNQLHLQSLPLESHLPFSVPLLAASRLSQIGGAAYNIVFDNLTFVLSGFRDGNVQHQSIYFPALSAPMPYLIAMGTIALAWDAVRTRRVNPILVVVLTVVAPIVTLPLNVTRLNWFYIPALMVVANLVNLRLDRQTAVTARLGRLWLIATGGYIALFLAMFYPYYFIRYNDEIQIEDVRLGNGFRVGLEDAMRRETALAAPDEPMLAAIGTVHPYLYPLFYGLSDLDRFRATRQMQIEKGVFKVSSFDRFYFERDALPAGKSFVFVTRSDRLPCAAPEIAYAGPLWTVGRCRP